MSRGVDGERGGKGGVWDSWGSLLMTINRLTVMAICDKSLGEESPQRLPAPNQTGYLKKKKNTGPVRVIPSMTTQEKDEEEEKTDQSFRFDRLGGKDQRFYLEGK